MKTKWMWLVSLLVVTSMATLPVSAKPAFRDVLTYKNTGDTILVGDLVKISPDYEHYETTEHIIHWAFDSIYTVRQVTSRFHPDGILLNSIDSWIPADAAVFVSREIKEIETPPIVQYDTILRTDIDSILLRIDTIISTDTIYQEKIPCIDTLPPVVESVPTIEPMPDTDTAADVDTCDTTPREIDRFTLALRGGFASTMAMPSTLETLPLGYDARIDLQYAHYWPTKNGKCHLGLMLGASAGYMNVERNISWDELYTTSTYDMGLPIDIQYHVTAENIHENLQQWQVEVPLMFSLISKSGVYFNVGPRFILPIYTPFKQNITNGNIWVKDLGANAEMPHGNAIYGELKEDQLTMEGISKHKYSWTVTLGFELGYEFRFQSGHSIGLGMYANYGLYNATYGLYNFNGTKSASSPIAITPPVDGTIAVVEVKALSDSYTTMMGHLDAGLKLSFNFDFSK